MQKVCTLDTWFNQYKQQHVRFLPENPELDGYVPDQEKPHKQTESQKSPSSELSSISLQGVFREIETCIFNLLFS